jgi:hypothetical protein
MGATPSSKDAGTGEAVGENTDEEGMADNEVGVEDSESLDDVEAVVAEVIEEMGADEDVGIEERVVGKSPVTVTNDPEATGACKKVAEERGSGVEGRCRQYDDSWAETDIVGFLI